MCNWFQILFWPMITIGGTLAFHNGLILGPTILLASYTLPRKSPWLVLQLAGFYFLLKRGCPDSIQEALHVFKLRKANQGSLNPKR
jgi:hypothetical protein